MATVRELVVSLGLDFDSTGFAKAERAIAVLKSGFAGMAGLLAGAAAGLTGITIAVSKQADELRDLSLTLGVSTEALQKLGYAAQLSGANAETMRTGLIFLTRQAEAAGSGSKEAAANFAKFGVNLRDQNGHLKTADRLFLDVANGAQKLKDPTERAALAAQLLGRSAGPQLVQLLSQGEAGIQELGLELEALGGLMDGDFIDASADFNDSLDRLQVAVKGFGITIAKAFLPYLSGAVKGLVEWYRANREVINSRVTFFVSRMGSAFQGLGNLIGLAVQAVSKIVSAFGKANPVFLSVLLVMGALALAFLSPTFAIILLTGLIAAIADDINTFVTGGKSVLGDFVDFLKKWGHDTGGVIGGFVESIADALAFFSGAGWDEVFEAFGRVWDEVANSIGESVDWLMGKWRALRDGLASIFGGSTTEESNTGPQFNMMADARNRYYDEGGELRNIARVMNGGRDALMTGGASSIKQAVAQQTAASVNNVANSANSTTNASITVNAAPGQSAKEVASEVAKKLEESNKARLRNARSAIVPAKATP